MGNNQRENTTVILESIVNATSHSGGCLIKIQVPIVPDINPADQLSEIIAVKYQ